MPDLKDIQEEKTSVPIGQIVSSVQIFEVIVKFKFGRYYFYFLNGEAVTVFLSVVGVKGSVTELYAKKKGKKFFLPEDENSLGEEIEVIEQDGKGIKEAIDLLEEKLRGVISEFKSLDFGLTDAVVHSILQVEDE